MKAAERMYATRYSEKRHLTRRTMNTLLCRAQYGDLNRKKTGSQDNKILVILAAVE